MSFGTNALASLEANDPEKLKAAFAGNDVDATVRNGVYGGATLFSGMIYEEGDTMLHLALRNKKWPIREVCVVTLEADATVRNAHGWTAPGIHMLTTGQRAGASLLCLACVHFKAFGLDLGFLGYAIAGFMAILGTVDHLLAWRWYGLAQMHKEAQKKGVSGTSTKGRAKGKERQSQKQQAKQ